MKTKSETLTKPWQFPEQNRNRNYSKNAQKRFDQNARNDPGARAWSKAAPFSRSMVKISDLNLWNGWRTDDLWFVIPMPAPASNRRWEKWTFVITAGWRLRAPENFGNSRRAHGLTSRNLLEFFRTRAVSNVSDGLTCALNSARFLISIFTLWGNNEWLLWF